MNCACGQPLHYLHPVAQQAVEQLVAEVGETVDVTVGRRTWKVQRHYIALHGIKGETLALVAKELGFEEVKRV